jgi:hypothetical protein
VEIDFAAEGDTLASLGTLVEATRVQIEGLIGTVVAAGSRIDETSDA